ncbi:hypothetical protein BDB01DRAFT_569487 [Pilobolus umbonatus]|nr:hypothetical protein BDB01DRAFT_569487 [Pilobolus umbonatus]
MKAEYCVDYLSHKWTSDDLLHTYRETRKEYKRHVMSHLLLSNQSTITAGDEKTLNGERTKLLRFQNALWREMARNCTNKLSQSNEMIHPSSVSWQKESDITWFYGPMYTDRIDKDDNKLHASVQAYSVPSLQGLKPVLKKQSNVTRLLPSCSDSICSMDNNSL